VGRDEQGVDSNSGRVIVKIDPRYFRPTEVESLLGDASKAQRQLGWKSETSFETLVQEMVAADLAIARRDALVAREGFRTYQNRE
jgi:GDPmannose 4,6-dehydratase